MEMRDGYKISQDDINLKLFQELEKLSVKIDKSEERAEKFFEKADKRAENFQVNIKERMDKFESNITSRLNWSLGILTLVVVGVLVTGIWKLVSIDGKQSEIKVKIVN